MIPSARTVAAAEYQHLRVTLDDHSRPLGGPLSVGFGPRDTQQPIHPPV